MTDERRVVVTGGAGFIGSHLVELLLELGHEVTVLDNFVSSRPGTLEVVGNSSRLRVVEVDIAGGGDLSPHLVDASWVFHLAALADIVPSIEHPLTYHRSNVDGTVAILEAARSAGVERFIYAASSSCYGIPEAYPTPETSPTQPRYPYALTKYVGEQYVLHWGALYDMAVVSLRLFNVYGPRSRTTGAYGAVFGVFLAQKLAGLPFTVVGDGTQQRDFVFVTDVAKAFLAAAQSNIRSEVLNVGSGRATSVNRLVELLQGPVVNMPLRPGEPDLTLADTMKIERLLGWVAVTQIEDGVRQLLENIEYWRSAPVWTAERIQETTRAWFRHVK